MQSTCWKKYRKVQIIHFSRVFGELSLYSKWTLHPSYENPYDGPVLHIMISIVQFHTEKEKYRKLSRTIHATFHLPLRCTFAGCRHKFPCYDTWIASNDIPLQIISNHLPKCKQCLYTVSLINWFLARGIGFRGGGRWRLGGKLQNCICIWPPPPPPLWQ